MKKFMELSENEKIERLQREIDDYRNACDMYLKDLAKRDEIIKYQRAQLKEVGYYKNPRRQFNLNLQ